MSNNFAIKATWEEIRTRAFGTIAAGYMSVGTPVTNVVRTYIIQNKTDEELMFSFDGITDHLIFSPGESFVHDVMANKTNQENFYIQKGDQLYVKRVGVPTTGAVYFSVCYGGV